MKKLLSTLILLLMTFMAHAQTQINGIYYNLDSSTKTAEVTKNPNKYSGNVSVPSTVTYGGYSYRVTSIGEWAFYWCPNLTSVTIPNSVTSIGVWAFYYCSNLTSVTIPNSVTSIGDNAFYSCSSLTSITIPNSVTTIGSGAFEDCSSLTSITIPNSVTSIGNGTFSSCFRLTSINVDSSNPKYDSRNNCNAIIETLSNTLIASCKNTIIPNSVTSIGDYAFFLCSGLSSITIPSSVTSIGYHAFQACFSLTSITIPSSIKKISAKAFQDCDYLQKVNISDISAWCKIDFGYEDYEGQLDFSSNPLNCAHNLYLNDELITDFVFPSDMDTIGNAILAGCSSLKSVTIPNNVTSIGTGAFYCCSGLTSILIPNSVETIGEYAFYNWEESNLTSVIVENPTPVSINQNTFSNRKNATLYVPTGSKSAYQAANYWKDFKEIIEKDMSHDAGLGDVNGDGEISVADVTMLVDYLLEQAPNSFILANADVNKDGRITISDAVSIIKKIVEGDPEPQAYLTCPDDHHPHMIDLGLPSGTKWACCNVGADKPEDYGGYYAWGETEEKTSYLTSTYKYYQNGEFVNIGDDIAGTQYDVAHVKWGGSWVMPSYDQQVELINNCTITYTNQNSENGMLLIGPNGGSIFLPPAYYQTYINYDEPFVVYFGSDGFYWSSTLYSSDSRFAKHLYFRYNDWYYLDWHFRSDGLPVRPVSR